MPFPELRRDPSRCLTRNLQPSHDGVLQHQTSVEFLTGHDRQELQWVSFPELDQADRFDGP